jgi:large subunit ribosomal protein L33
MARAPKETTFLVSSAGTGFFYVNRKNKKKLKGDKKLSLMKYDPIARKKVAFEEKKLSAVKKKAAAPAAAAATTQTPAK